MSGLLHCLKCNQKVEAESFAKADELIDHAKSSKKCAGDPANMVWYETPKKAQDPKPTVTKKAKN